MCYKRHFQCDNKKCKVSNIEKFETYIICNGCSKLCKADPMIRQKKVHVPKIIPNLKFKNLECFEIKTGKNSRYFNAGNYSLYWNTGNSKVFAPILNVGSALNCSSKLNCSFHLDNYKQTGYPICYACRDELQYPSVLSCHLVNEKSLQLANVCNDSYDLGFTIGLHIANYCKSKNLKYCRINEAGDLAIWNITFLKGFLTALKSLNISAWLYTKQIAISKELEAFENLQILISERDFKVFKKGTKPEFPVCQGVGCGLTCLRCPQGKKTSIEEH